MQTDSKIYVFGETEQHNHPLILIVDREPCQISNNPALIDYYGKNWTESWTGSTCRARNTSFSLFSTYMNLAGAELKSLCAARRSSPLIYTTASPRIAPAATTDARLSAEQKRAYRQNTPEDILEQHIELLFSQPALTPRVGLIALAGLQDCGLERSIDKLAERSRQHDIALAHIPTLNTARGVTKHARLQALEPHRVQIETIMHSFREGDSRGDQPRLSAAA